MARVKSGRLTAVRAANSWDEAEALSRAVDYYRSRLGEPGVDEALVTAVEEAFREAEAEALRVAEAAGTLVVGPGGMVTVADAVGKGRRSTASGPVSEKDAVFRLVSLIVGGKEALEAYDRKQGSGRLRVQISEDTEETFAGMRSWTPAQWDDLEERLEKRMGGIEDEGCGGCRRSAAYATARGLAPRPCRSCG